MSHLSVASEYEDQNEKFAGVSYHWLRKRIHTLSIKAMFSALTKYEAAVRIQTVFRGWRARQLIKRWHLMATKIQRFWRGFIIRQYFYALYTQMVQQRVMDYYDHAATEIQRMFRGFWSRKYIHNQVALKMLRLSAAKNVLECVAIKVHGLLKDQQIPGVFSLRNSRCLPNANSVVETIKIERYNEEYRQKHREMVTTILEAFDTCKKSRERTMLPFERCPPRMPDHQNVLTEDDQFDGSFPSSSQPESVDLPSIEK